VARQQKSYYVYIMANYSRTLYVGVTNDLQRRAYEHKNKLFEDSFSARYNINRLVYFEETNDVLAAIEREKQIKRWRREKKVFLIEQQNPDWRDLSEEWQ
jgi:putative endonuclease